MSEHETVTEPGAESPPPSETAPETPGTDADDVVTLAPALSDEAVQLAAMKTELDANTARLRTVSVAYRKLQEEFGAFRERQDRQNAIRQESLKGDTVKRLFEPMENLRRSLDALSKAGVGDDALSGLEMVWRDFLAGFKDLGLEELGHKGDVFDPALHEGLTIMPVEDPAMDGRVIEVFSQGYRVGSRLIRPARVVVGQHSPEPVAEA